MTFFQSLSNCSTTLVVDFNGPAASQLAEQLIHSGFRCEVAITAQAAQTAARTKHYEAIVMVFDLNQADDVRCLRHLRKCAPRSWIIVISSRPCTDPHQLIFRCGADSLLIAPFSIRELTFRLSALLLRSRPR
jgi:two-component system response regulator MprA